MSSTPSSAAQSELERLAQQYESSASWRLTRPLRAAGRVARRLRPASAEVPSRGAAEELKSFTPGRFDAWLEHFFGEQLQAIDVACADGAVERYALFRELDDDLWALLLTCEYELYPNIRSLLPAVPDAWIQELWNGASGAGLAAQGQAFYTRLRGRFAEHGAVPLAQARVLDFGCGWGRLTRFLARDVAPGHLYGCDPVQGIVDACRASRVPARVERVDFVPDRLPFPQKFDLAFAFSVFTHLSERAHEACLSALHQSLQPGGLLILTVRAPEYLWSCELMRATLESLGPGYRERLSEPLYLFVAHPADAGHPQYHGAEMTYGETVITGAYIRERWSTMFELLRVDLLIGDLQQVMLTLRRRG
jgi:SAM-dependent methyltransferase